MSRLQKATRPRLVLAWLMVSVPLGWGVYQSVVKSLPLFQAATTAAPASDPPGK
jgi:hypothetical protein